MKLYKKALLLVAILASLAAVPVVAATLQGYQGGTGYATSTGANDGNCLKQASSSPFLTWTIGACGSGSGATTTINEVVGPTFTFSIVATTSPSSITTTTAQLFLNLLVYSSSSQITISPTGTIIFASNNISQFTNNVPYLTSSTGVTTTTGNWQGTWQNNNPSDFKSSSTPSSVTTSSVPTAFYFPYWANITGGLSGTSTIFYSSSTGNIGIGTVSPSSTLHVVGTQQTTQTSTFGGSVVVNSNNLIDGNGNKYSTSTVANPSGPTVGLSTINGTATTSLRSDVGLQLCQNCAFAFSALGNTTSTGNIGAATLKASSSLSVGTSTASGTLFVVGTSTLGNTIISTNNLVDAGGNRYSTSTPPSIATTTKSIYDSAPSSTDDIVMFYTETATTLKQVDCINDNIAGNTVAFNITWGSARNATSSNAFTTPQVCSATTTIQTIAINGSTTIAAGSIIRFVASGTPSAVSSTGVYVDFKF